MKRMAQRPETRNNITQAGTMLACSNVISGTFEYDGSRVFNKLPQKCRDELEYKDFCIETKKYLLDQAFAKSFI